VNDFPVLSAGPQPTAPLDQWKRLACQMMAKMDVILMPDQRVRVFVSSTLEELAEERAAARRSYPIGIYGSALWPHGL
jgi:hypothetical protein